jgi:IS30 family transposase
MPKPYTHLSLEERAQIQVWLDHDLKPRAIARKLGRAASTITRELSRNTTHQPVTNAATVVELHVRVALLNRFTQLERPTTVPVAAVA